MPDYDFSAPRLHVEDALAEGATLAATPEQANYLMNVMRLGAGDAVLLFNGRDGEWLAGLAPVSKKRLDLTVQRMTRPQTPAPDLHYLFAPLKSARLDYMVQKAVEMGAGVLQPVMTQHCQAPRIKLDRMRANAVEAAEQCGILSIAECRDMVRLNRLLDGWDAGRQLIFCDERAVEAAVLDILSPLAGRPLALLIGPEGGFSADERSMLTQLPFVTAIPLGPRILRADTAAVAAMAVVQAAAGDWRA